MTNPNNAVGTNAAYNGRTSVDAFNDVMGAFSGRGVLSGWNCIPGTGMTVQLGGDGSTRDAAIAEDNAGNRTSVNNISGSPVEVAIAAAPATGNRIDLVVAYVDNPPTGVSTEADNPQACGIIDVTGTAATNPTAPNETAIRNAITADGATGASAYYVILAQVRVGTNVTSIGSGVITQGARATLGAGTVTSDSIDFATFEYSTTEQVVGMFNNSTLYRRSYAVAAGPQPGADAQISIASDIAMAVKVEGYLSNGGIVFPLPSPRITLANTIAVYVDIINKRIVLESGSDRSGYSGYVTLYYIKS